MSGIKARCITALGMLVFAGFAVGAWLSGEWYVSPVFVLFAAWALLEFASLGDVELDAEGVTHSTLRGRYGIAWREVERIETDPMGAHVLLEGDGKRLVLPGPTYWPRAVKAAFVTGLRRAVELHEIPRSESPRAAYLLSKNTRLR